MGLGKLWTPGQWIERGLSCFCGQSGFNAILWNENTCMRTWHVWVRIPRKMRLNGELMCFWGVDVWAWVGAEELHIGPPTPCSRPCCSLVASDAMMTVSGNLLGMLAFLCESSLSRGQHVAAWLQILWGSSPIISHLGCLVRWLTHRTWQHNKQQLTVTNSSAVVTWIPAEGMLYSSASTWPLSYLYFGGTCGLVFAPGFGPSMLLFGCPVCCSAEAVMRVITAIFFEGGQRFAVDELFFWSDVRPRTRLFL